MSSAVRVSGLAKRYGEVRAVDGIDLEIERGEVFALLGPNGAGKSTTVEILEGHRRRDAGRVEVLGHDPGRATRQWRARLGIVAQTTREAPELTVREMVRHFAGYYPRPRDPDEVIEAVGLTDKTRTRLAGLSGGQRRRVDVALGIVGDPELLFLDEPTTGFDPEARRAFWELIRGLAHDGTTIVLTTHYMEEAEVLADRVAVIAGGRILAVDTPRELGGRATEVAEVSWLEPAEGRRTLRAASPTQVVAELAERFGGEVPGLTVARPTLEDVYLRMIGETQ
ncbi:ABC-2 type transport system ATP-binding protein [Thermomonospora echinospora]|uniref:ABC-2 type transport system ATP-binding protein n=1 Tax=Thermomonospora echinospora TaxID=1992 RepID=A0A1H5VX02_9ACTN|nr:ABC transporter ATP-binding protein [Thermomonospora echinospora]SEF91401.1 ABC-2 type transport system ATP-binding protein [Thermomonospora echinospora]